MADCDATLRPAAEEVVTCNHVAVKGESAEQERVVQPERRRQCQCGVDELLASVDLIRQSAGTAAGQAAERASLLETSQTTSLTGAIADLKRVMRNEGRIQRIQWALTHADIASFASFADGTLFGYQDSKSLLLGILGPLSTLEPLEDPYFCGADKAAAEAQKTKHISFFHEKVQNELHGLSETRRSLTFVLSIRRGERLLFIYQHFSLT